MQWFYSHAVCSSTRSAPPLDVDDLLVGGDLYRLQLINIHDALQMRAGKQHFQRMEDTTFDTFPLDLHSRTERVDSTSGMPCLVILLDAPMQLLVIVGRIALKTLHSRNIQTQAEGRAHQCM